MECGWTVPDTERVLGRGQGTRVLVPALPRHGGVGFPQPGLQGNRGVSLSASPSTSLRGVPGAPAATTPSQGGPESA